MWMYLDERGLNSKSFKEAPKIQTNKLKLKRPKIACWQLVVIRTYLTTIIIYCLQLNVISGREFWGKYFFC